MSRVSRIFLFWGLAALVLAPYAFPQQLQIHCIDVGQGSSELVIGPNGTTILIDGGTSGKGRDEVIPYIDALFAPATPVLDYIIASHDDNDHYGGLNYIIDYSGYSIGTIYHCGDNAGFGEGVQIPLGTVIDLGDGARATCVGRYGQFIDGSSGNTDSNNLSICLLIEYGGFDYITAGDLSENEDELSSALIGYPTADPYLDPAEGVDVIHINHHGSDGASHYYYVNRLKHEVALINGGTNYGHPRWTAVDRLKGRATYSDGSGATGVTWTGCTSVYRTTYDDPDDGRAPEWDCPTLGDMVVTYDGCAEYYYVEEMPYPVDEWIVCTTPSPTPEGYHTPTPTPSLPPTPPPTPSLPPTPSSTPTPTTTPSVSPTPEGYRTPTPTPSATPSPSSTPTPPASPTPPPAAFPFYDGFESGEFGESWSIVTDNEGKVLVSMEYQFSGTYSALLDSDNGTYSTAGLILTIDLSAQTDVDLAFQWREFFDENHAQDGVFISDNYGGAWSQLTSFNNGPYVFTSALFDLSSAAAAAGLSLNDHFQIKFQMYDNFSIPTDGYAVDDVRVCRLATPTPSATPTSTPEGYRTPTPPPSTTPTPSSTPTPPAASFPFYDGFESGMFGESWSIMTESEGRVLVSMEYQFAGTYSALLDDSKNNTTYSTAGLILTIDLSTQTDVDLAFQWREFADENDPEDGVFISDDYGGAWSQLTSFNNGPSVFTYALFDLSAAAASSGLSLNDHFQVKFQMYDNYSIPTDGYAVDDVRVWRLVTPTPSPTPEGYHTPIPTPSATPTLTPTRKDIGPRLRPRRRKLSMSSTWRATRDGRLTPTGRSASQRVAALMTAIPPPATLGSMSMDITCPATIPMTCHPSSTLPPPRLTARR